MNSIEPNARGFNGGVDTIARSAAPQDLFLGLATGGPELASPQAEFGGDLLPLHPQPPKFECEASRLQFRA